jgi:hypothetical protein
MDICEVIPSIHNKHKINVYGFIMIKDKNRNYMYYWYCEKRDMLNCKGRATTILTEDQHHLVKPYKKFFMKVFRILSGFFIPKMSRILLL